MKSVYVIMKERYSPNAITQQYPHEVVFSLSKARSRVEFLNSRAKKTVYWPEKVKCNGVQQEATK